MSQNRRATIAETVTYRVCSIKDNGEDAQLFGNRWRMAFPDGMVSRLGFATRRDAEMAVRALDEAGIDVAAFRELEDGYPNAHERIMLEALRW